MKKLLTMLLISSAGLMFASQPPTTEEPVTSADGYKLLAQQSRAKANTHRSMANGALKAANDLKDQILDFRSLAQNIGDLENMPNLQAQESRLREEARQHDQEVFKHERDAAAFDELARQHEPIFE